MYSLDPEVYYLAESKCYVSREADNADEHLLI